MVHSSIKKKLGKDPLKSPTDRIEILYDLSIKNQEKGPFKSHTGNRKERKGGGRIESKTWEGCFSRNEESLLIPLGISPSFPQDSQLGLAVGQISLGPIPFRIASFFLGLLSFCRSHPSFFLPLPSSPSPFSVRSLVASQSSEATES